MKIRFFEIKSKTESKSLQISHNNNYHVQDYYKILGVEKNATLEAIKSAYRKLSLKYHPDKNKDASASSVFITIHNAYQILSNPTLRAQYDRGLFCLLESSSDSKSRTLRQLLSNRTNEAHLLITRKLILFQMRYFIALMASFSFATSEWYINENSYFRENDRNFHSLIYPTFVLFSSFSCTIFSPAINIANLNVSLPTLLPTFAFVSLSMPSHYYVGHYALYDSSSIFYEDHHVLYDSSPMDYQPEVDFFEDVSSIPPVIDLPKLSSNQQKLDDANFEGEIPQDFICLLSGAIMTYPVHNPQKGLPNVEKAWILIQIKEKGLNPFNNQPLTVKDLKKNKELKKSIDAFVKKAVKESVNEESDTALVVHDSPNEVIINVQPIEADHNQQTSTNNRLSFFYSAISTAMSAFFEGSTVNQILNNAENSTAENDESTCETENQRWLNSCSIM